MAQTRTLPNEGTRIAHRRSTFLDEHRASRTPSASSPPSLRDDGVLVAALERAARERAERMDSAALVLVTRWPLSVGVDDVFARVVFVGDDDGCPRALVLGRHSEADTPPLPGASLRHAVVLAWPSPAGEPPRVEVIDLHTDVGIGVVGGAAAHLENTGPMVFGIGAADVVVVPVAARDPVAPAGARGLLRSLVGQRPPVRRWRDGASDGGSLAQVLAWHDELVRAGARRTGSDAAGDAPRVDVRAEAVRLPQPVRRSTPREPLDPAWRRQTVTSSSIVASPDRLAQLRGRGGDDDAPLVVSSTWAELEDGILLGRYPRCVAHDSINDDGVSRVHALVVARRQRLFVVDTGSTNGTTLRLAGGRERVLHAHRRVLSADDDAQLWLHKRRCVIRVNDDGPADADRGPGERGR
jgi:hypothetical protein